MLGDLYGSFNFIINAAPHGQDVSLQGCERQIALPYLCLEVMKQNGTDQHTAHQEKCLSKVEDD